MLVASIRTALRLGQDIPELEATQLSYLLPIPLFHCTGSCSISIPATLFGGKIVLMRKWDASQGMKFGLSQHQANYVWRVWTGLDIIEKEKITNTGGWERIVGFGSPCGHLIITLSVPSIAMDLLAEKDFERRGASLVALAYGGTTAPPQIAEKVGRLRGALTK
jgi:acyl-CoA synthetase (AMP-forming)/AMP-acid ligase II